MSNQCGCNHWCKPKCPERGCPWNAWRAEQAASARLAHEPVTPFGLPLFWDANVPGLDGSFIDEGTKEQEPVGYQQLFNAIAYATKTPYEGYTTQQQRKPQFKEFIEWAGSQGYDCAYTCNSDTGEWIALNPMTADLWKSWQAALGIK
jgi:hypothetical protein